MSSFGIRPRFTQTLDLRLDEAQARLARAVDEGADGCEMKVSPGFICLRIPEQDRHFWSPRLNLGLEATEDGGTRIEGIYGIPLTSPRRCHECDDPLRLPSIAGQHLPGMPWHADEEGRDQVDGIFKDS